MRKSSFSLIVAMVALFAVAVFSGLGFADSDSVMQDALHKAYPNFKVDKFRPSPIKDIFEVEAEGQIFYFSPDGHLIFGEIWSKNGVNLTAERRNAIKAKAIKDIPLAKAIKIGTGSNVIIEFSDPDCPYCRRASEELDKLANVTRYVFFMPLRQLHAKAELHSKYILSKNSAEAYNEVYSGKLDDVQIGILPNQEKEVSARLKEHEAIAKKMGVEGTPAFWVNGKFVNGANIPAIKKILSEDKISKKEVN